MYLTVAKGVTYCPDTPENWKNFERLKAKMQAGESITASKGLSGEALNQALQARIRSENKRLRSMSRHLPGYEPDR